MKWLALVDDYLRDRRNLGYKLEIDGRILQSFAIYADKEGVPVQLELTKVKEWANLAPSGSEIAIARRMAIVRALSLYLHILEPTSPVIETSQIGRTHRRLPGYIYNQEDSDACLMAASNLLPAYGIRPLTMHTLLGLLISSGLRPGEAVRLKKDDVNLSTSILTVNQSKNWCRRLVPINISTTKKLKMYCSIRSLFEPLKHTDSFFLMDSGQGLNIETADNAFKVIRRQVGLDHKINDRYPRLYDFRHTFVCRRIQSWYESGADVNSLIPQLSRYLGHKKIQDTYWYITATPELMSAGAKRFADHCGLGGDE
ncbi:MAG: tyrosine-type recombinase/integrase [Colwellia sp.]|jgi:Site-specific recombinase XerD